jgi:hypothetical protein
MPAAHDDGDFLVLGNKGHIFPTPLQSIELAHSCRDTILGDSTTSSSTSNIQGSIPNPRKIPIHTENQMRLPGPLKYS